VNQQLYSFSREDICLPLAAPLTLGGEGIDEWVQHYTIEPVISILLKNIVQADTGRPKSAHEIYDEDYGYTIDVYEQSPFLSVVFKLKGDTYRASFQSFESDTPKEWCNQIIALKYQLKSSVSTE
jgi:hypothetical protein